jgi:hypothetical protein
LRSTCILLVVACKSTPSPPPSDLANRAPAAPPVSAPTCENAIDHALALEPTVIARVHDIAVDHCMRDHWSADAIGCYARATTITSSAACMLQLTRSQFEALHAADVESFGAKLPESALVPRPPP